jgi:hypothetical protein
MFAGHAQDWLADNVAFALSLIPLVLLSLIGLAARLQANRRRPALARVRAHRSARI